MKHQILLKIMQKEYYPKKCKCSRCKTPISADREFYKNKDDIIVCRKCVTEKDFMVDNTCYFGTEGLEIFRFLMYNWNVTSMYDYAQKHMEIVHIAVEDLTGYGLRGFVHINEENMKKVDIDKPCILGALNINNSSQIIIDGNHRVERAIREGRKTIPFYVFDFRTQLRFMATPDFFILNMFLEKALNE